MKNFKVIGICLMMCISLVPIREVHAASIEITDDGLYSFNRDTRSITAYNPNDLPDVPKEVTIPETVRIGNTTYTVEAIGDSAFDSGDNVTKVIIADSVKQANNAFNGCPELSQIVLGKGIPELRAIIGKNLPKMTSFTVPKTVKTLAKTLPFTGCTNLTELIFEEGFESIVGAKINIFNQMDNLKRVVLPSTVTSIDANAFGANANLMDIVIDQEEATSPVKDTKPWGAGNGKAVVTWKSGGGTTSVGSHDVKVYYDPSNKIPDVDNPVDAKWSVVIPKAINFTQQANGENIEANVTLKSENGNTLPSGNNVVKVSIASTNGFQLNYNSENVAYEVTYVNDLGTTEKLDSTSGNNPKVIGTLQESKTTITSNAKVTGTATAIGTYKDTLTYSIEKVTLLP